MIARRIHLASQSPRRRELLRQIGVAFDVLPLRASHGRADVVEIPHPCETPPAFAERLAREKAAAGWHAVDGRGLMRYPVLGADTVVEIDGEIFGKPADRVHARAMLARLGGRSHWVHSAVAVCLDTQSDARLSSSRVEFAPLDDIAIARYLDSGEFSGKAGAYAIQGRAAMFIARIEGSYSGIMGLPLFETAALLKRFGVL
jgi:septum formation protein